MNQQRLDEWQEGMRFAVVADIPPEPRIVSQHKTAAGAVREAWGLQHECDIVGVDSKAERELFRAHLKYATERLLEVNPWMRQ